MLAVALFVSVLLLTVKGNDPVTVDYYTAAVYEHARFGKFPEDAMSDIITKNLIAYENATSAAAEKGADIIVFPEYGLYPLTNRTVFKEYAEFIPDPEHVTWNLCKSTADRSIASKLSCIAKDNNIYLVANMLSIQPCTLSDPDCPADNVYIYNTNVIFNRKGELIARYHKYHLYFEQGTDIPKKFEYVAFKTEFATIGTFICFDIMWNTSVELLQKYKIDTLVYPTFWVEAYPMYTSIQTMNSWSLVNNINILGANVEHPSTGGVGSGIFLGASRISHYVYQPNGKSKLIVAKVPINASKNTVPSDEVTVMEFENTWGSKVHNNISSGQCSEKILGPPKNSLDFRCVDTDLSNFTLVKLQRDENTVRGCNNRLCCLVKYDVTDMDEDYYLAIVNGTTYIKNYYGIWEETCMVIRCDQYNGTKCSTFPTKSRTVFNKLIMKANITSIYVYPSILTSGIRLLPPEKWSYTNSTLSLSTDDGLLFAVLNGRPYERDPPYPIKNYYQQR